MSIGNNVNDGNATSTDSLIFKSPETSFIPLADQEQAIAGWENAVNAKNAALLKREESVTSREEAILRRENAADVRDRTANDREDNADANENIAVARDGVADVRDGTADQREDNIVIRETRATVREKEILAEETLKAASNHLIIMLQKANAHLVTVSIEAHKMAEQVKVAKEQLAYLAHHDVLTDLPNRILLLD